MWAERWGCGESDFKSERGRGRQRKKGVRETGQLFGEADIFSGKGCDAQMRQAGEGGGKLGFPVTEK